ncbi:MAG: hypothetical protein DMG05_05500 [Acidobacteria bacterium]|nr:MAG: hypothetical protein DMG05_05500 [Acidobacteriota bacterium]
MHELCLQDPTDTIEPPRAPRIHPVKNKMPTIDKTEVLDKSLEERRQDKFDFWVNEFLFFTLGVLGVLCVSALWPQVGDYV